MAACGLAVCKLTVCKPTARRLFVRRLTACRLAACRLAAKQVDSGLIGLAGSHFQSGRPPSLAWSSLELGRKAEVKPVSLAGCLWLRLRLVVRSESSWTLLVDQSGFLVHFLAEFAVFGLG